MKRAAGVLGLIALAAALLAGCSNQPVQAPVLERAPPAAARPVPVEAGPDFYTVRRGDTMFSIALDHGLDYKELAAWNNIDNPGRIHPGQQLRIKPSVSAQQGPVTVNPISSAGRVETHQLGAQAPGTPAGEGAFKSGPQARKLPYSPENVALLERGAAQAMPPPPPAAAPTPAPTAVAPAAVPAAVPAPSTPAKPDADDEDKVDWGWPVKGTVIAGFSESSNKGLDIAAKIGDPVVASSAGRVVYSGSGLRGYGKLVIIKHNKTYLSAYAHNSVILVKEGQNVVKGQKIAEVGNSDSDKPMLHFEIRKLGKPVDPARYLPPT